MKIALVTDLHFGARNDHQKVAAFQKKFYDEVFFPYIDEHGIKCVFDLGDTFDRRKFISYTSLKAAKEMFFEPLKSRGIETHIMLVITTLRIRILLRSIALICYLMVTKTLKSILMQKL